MCERKVTGLVKSWQVFNALPQAVFTMSQISIVDPRFDDSDDDGPTPRVVYTVEMTREEWEKLAGASYKRGVATAE